MTVERDAAWFDALYRRWHQPVLAYARRRVTEPDDLVAEVFTTAWRCRSGVPDPPLPWLLRTASNLSLHAARGARRRNRLAARVGSQRPGQEVDRRRRSSTVRRPQRSCWSRWTRCRRPTGSCSG